MEDEIFEMGEFVVDPQRGAGAGEILPSIKPDPTAERTMRS